MSSVLIPKLSRKNMKKSLITKKSVYIHMNSKVGNILVKI